jgi:hypothetical protein
MSGFHRIDSGLTFDKISGLQVPGTSRLWNHSRTTAQLMIAQLHQTKKDSWSGTCGQALEIYLTSNRLYCGLLPEP